MVYIGSTILIRQKLNKCLRLLVKSSMNLVKKKKAAKKKKIKKKIGRRPINEIIHIKNKDKTGHEKWDEKRSKDIANWPAPTRICVIGECNSGKTNLIKNILLHASPRYDEVYLIHPDVEHSKEYSNFDMTAEMSEFPPAEFWEREGKHKKRCCVIDDMTSPTKDSEQDKRLGLMMRYISTHKSMTIIYSHQSWFNIPVLVKKMSNVFIIHKVKNRIEMEQINTRLGMKRVI